MPMAREPSPPTNAPRPALEASRPVLETSFNIADFAGPEASPQPRTAGSPARKGAARGKKAASSPPPAVSIVLSPKGRSSHHAGLWGMLCLANRKERSQSPGKDAAAQAGPAETAATEPVATEQPPDSIPQPAGTSKPKSPQPTKAVNKWTPPRSVSTGHRAKSPPPALSPTGAGEDESATSYAAELFAAAKALANQQSSTVDGLKVYGPSATANNAKAARSPDTTFKAADGPSHGMPASITPSLLGSPQTVTFSTEVSSQAKGSVHQPKDLSRGSASSGASKALTKAHAARIKAQEAAAVVAELRRRSNPAAYKTSPSARSRSSLNASRRGKASGRSGTQLGRTVAGEELSVLEEEERRLEADLADMHAVSSMQAAAARAAQQKQLVLHKAITPERATKPGRSSGPGGKREQATLPWEGPHAAAYANSMASLRPSQGSSTGGSTGKAAAAKSTSASAQRRHGSPLKNVPYQERYSAGASIVTPDAAASSTTSGSPGAPVPRQPWVFRSPFSNVAGPSSSVPPTWYQQPNPGMEASRGLELLADASLASIDLVSSGDEEGSGRKVRAMSCHARSLASSADFRIVRC